MQCVSTLGDCRCSPLQLDAQDAPPSTVSPRMESSALSERLLTELPAWTRDRFRYRFPGGQSQQDCVQGMESLVIELERCKTTALVISHNSALQCLYGYFCGAGWCPNNRIDDVSVHFDGELPFFGVRLLKKVPHLPDSYQLHSIEIPRNTIIELVHTQYGWAENRYHFSDSGKACGTNVCSISTMNWPQLAVFLTCVALFFFSFDRSNLFKIFWLNVKENFAVLHNSIPKLKNKPCLPGDSRERHRGRAAGTTLRPRELIQSCSKFIKVHSKGAHTPGGVSETVGRFSSKSTCCVHVGMGFDKASTGCEPYCARGLHPACVGSAHTGQNTNILPDLCTQQS